ncbi:MAG: NYN domain-containing protein [Candidatus Aureabacteria bacterium]|nr:NYN domain-containing protein [Candidatus Auribacterota bacterium]
MNKYLIDAYNVMHEWRSRCKVSCQLLDVRSFLDIISPFADYRSEKIIVVFDGDHADAPSIKARYRNLEIIFSTNEASADSVIEKIVQEKQDSDSITVVTSDQIESDSAASSGARIMSPLSLWEIIESSRKDLDNAITRTRRSSRKKGFPIGDMFEQNS